MSHRSAANLGSSAAQPTSPPLDLRRLVPFTSHNLLRFSTSPLAAIPKRGDIAPPFVAAVPEPDRYVVFSGPVGAEPGAPSSNRATP